MEELSFFTPNPTSINNLCNLKNKKNEHLMS